MQDLLEPALIFINIIKTEDRVEMSVAKVQLLSLCLFCKHRQKHLYILS